jgi:hypothetical protein
MSSINAGIFARVASRIATMRRVSDFTCGDCERSDRCGLPPSDTCIVRAEQIARGDWKVRRRTKALLENEGWQPAPRAGRTRWPVTIFDVDQTRSTVRE